MAQPLELWNGQQVSEGAERRERMRGDDALRTVPVAWTGLSPAETYEQILDSLLALDGAVDEVRGRIELRVASERAELQSIAARISTASERAKRVAGSSSATVVLAASRSAPPSARRPSR